YGTGARAMAGWQPAVHAGDGPKPLCTQRPKPLMTWRPLESLTSPFSLMSWAPALKAPSARAQATARRVRCWVKVNLMVVLSMTALLCLGKLVEGHDSIVGASPPSVCGVPH